MIGIDNVKGAPISIIFIIFSVVISVLLHFQLVEPIQICYDKKLIFEGHEFWRLFTSILSFGDFSSSMIINLLFFADYLFTIENSYFGDRPFDYLIYTIFGWISIWLYVYFVPALFLSGAYDLYVTYYYYKRMNDFQGGMFGFAAIAPYIPFFLLFTSWMLNDKSQLYISLVGYGSSHLFYFLKDVISLRYDKHLLAAPDKLNNALLTLLS